MSISRLWFLLRTLPLRARFFFGKASFVEADIQMTTHSLVESLDGKPPPPGSRLLAHYQLETRRPRAGEQGWKLVLERVGGVSHHRTVLLRCDFCGHRYIVQVITALDPLAGEATGGKSPGEPASFTSDWFRFMDERYEGPDELDCLHCEQSGPANAEHLRRP